MISILTLIFVTVIILCVLDIRAKTIITLQSLKEINETLKQITANTKNSKETELNTIRAINEMCNALNQSFTTTGAFMNHTTYSLQNIVVCMIPFIDEIKQQAVKSEEYEKAQECVNIINNLKEIIKLPNKN